MDAALTNSKADQLTVAVNKESANANSTIQGLQNDVQRAVNQHTAMHEMASQLLKVVKNEIINQKQC